MELEQLKRKINEDIVNSQLKIDCIYYVLKDIYRDVADAYNAYLARAAAQEKGEDKNEK